MRSISWSSGLGRGWGALGAVSAALLLSACGTTSTGAPVGATTASGNASPIGLSRCMRANGLPNFPDPTMGSGGEGFNAITRSIDGELIVDGINFSGPAATRAERACARFLPPNGPPPPLTEARRKQLLAFARCVRSHGVPKFPDPQFPSGGSAGPPVVRQVAPNVGAPAVLKAARACGRGGQIRITAAP